MSEIPQFGVRPPKVNARLIENEDDLRWAAEKMSAKTENGRVFWTEYKSGYGDTVDSYPRVIHGARVGVWMVWLENQDPRNATFIPYQGRDLEVADLPAAMLRNAVMVFDRND